LFNAYPGTNTHMLTHCSKVMTIFQISYPVGSAVPKFGMHPQIMVQIKQDKSFCRDTASEPILGPHFKFMTLLNKDGLK